MSKINIEVELDFINEDYSLEDSFRDELKRNIESKILAKVSEKIEFELIKKRNAQLDKIINKETKKFIKNFLKYEIVITDEWGERNHKGTVKEKVKKALLDFTTKKVDDRGRDGGKYTNIEYIINKLIRDQYDSLKEHNEKIINNIIDNLKKNNEVSILKRLATKILADKSLVNFIEK